jgi:hypothetical protein
MTLLTRSSVFPSLTQHEGEPMKVRIDRPYMWTRFGHRVWKIHKVGQVIEICLGVFIINISWGKDA